MGVYHHNLVINGDLLVDVNSTSYGLRMYYANDNLTVTGDMAATNNAGSLNNGTLRLEGDLTVTGRDGFKPGAAHTTHMQASGAQAIVFPYGESGDNHFGSLVVDSGSTTTVGTMPNSPSRLYMARDLNVDGTLTVASGNDSTVVRDLNVPAGGVLTNNGSSMLVNGTCSTSSGTVNGSVTCAN